MTHLSEAPIGLFDSGLGGLTVAREIMRNLPDEKIVYFGDTARVPYGNKSKGTVVRYSEQILRFLLTQNIKAVVIACNTASAMALEALRDKTDLPVLGVVSPGAVMAVKATRNKRVGVMATKSTIASESYVKEIHRLDPEVTVVGEPCPLLVPLVEEGWTNTKITDEILQHYLDHLMAQQVDTIIMGCTHYPLLRNAIARLVGDEITLVNPAYETALALKKVLDENGLLNTTPANKADPYPYRFFVSDEAERFRDFAGMILPVDVRSAEMIPIEKY
ncbi:MAG: glutamate racemase [Lachnospiraceae bacterium]|nr:glutamate racemase [Lachnospiraceae bacterium]